MAERAGSRRSRPAGRRGAAMVETALLCLFLYVPLLMMVIIWGDMSLDKERAHAATSYMAFAHEPMDEARLVAQFFPTATGQSDATHSVRSVAPEADEETEGPTYTLPAAGTDYSGGPPEFDLQYKLYALAVGEVNISYELQPMPDGTVGFVSRWERIQDDVARYLTQNGVVNIGPLLSGPVTLPVGETLDLETGAASTAYTPYVEALTDLFNGRWDASGPLAGGAMGNMAPSLESRAGLRTWFTSPFLLDLERPALGGSSEPVIELPRVRGEPGFEMQFGATDLVPEDDSFRGGFTYLRNPAARLDVSRLRNDLYELSSYFFDFQGRRIHEMDEPLSRERGEEHLRFLEPGDPRPAEQG